METNLKAIVQLDADSGVDFSAALGCAVGADGALGGDFGVIVVVEPVKSGATTSTSAAVALFGGNAGPVEVKLGGTVAKGDFLVRNETTGVFTKAAATDVACARALEAGTSTELIAAILLPPAAAIGASVYAAADHDHDDQYEPLGS